jgi:hypothetical protein
MKLLIAIAAIFLLVACASVKQLGFSGTDLELSAGTEQGTDQGNPTHKMAYGTLVRFRFDVKEDAKPKETKNLKPTMEVVK